MSNLRNTFTLFLIVFLILQGCAPPSVGSLALNSTQFIVGGKNAIGTEIYAQSTVIVFDPTIRAVCTGSLLGNNIVLTAAHCLMKDKKNLLVIFSTQITNVPREKIRAVTGVVTHPSWTQNQNRTQALGDIGLIKFQGSVPDGYKPVQVMSNSYIPKNGETALLVGFGINDFRRRNDWGVLREVTVPILNWTYSSTEAVLDQRSGKGFCQGDSGGPAFIVIKGQPILFGISSRGHQETSLECNSLSVVTKVLPYWSWIYEMAKRPSF